MTFEPVPYFFTAQDTSDSGRPGFGQVHVCFGTLLRRVSCAPLSEVLYEAVLTGLLSHLLLLFGLFESKTEDPIIKSNAAIALGDMAIAFSTIMDENSDRLYEGLAAQDLNIKKNTLMVLTHLVRSKLSACQCAKLSMPDTTSVGRSSMV